MPIEGVESLEGYCTGGFHPITIGDHLHDQYQIVHKLGFGSYSTVWLAWDERTSKYVAIKIAAPADDSQESIILGLLQLANGHPLQALFPPILDEFFVTGPNGKHRCFVTLPARSSLYHAQYASDSGLFELSVARAIAAQVILAVCALHSQGIVHLDLHPGNILLRLPKGLDSISPDRFYEEFGKPALEPVRRLDNKPLPEGVPKYGVVPVWLGEKSDLIPLSDAEIFLTDFGESFIPSATSQCYSRYPGSFLPPEVYFLPPESLSFPADIWALGCVIWATMGRRSLFQFPPSGDWPLMIQEHIDLLGELPPEWWQKWGARSKWFKEPCSWEERFEFSVQQPRWEFGMELADEEEMAAFLIMLKAMLVYKPGERITAGEVRQSEWMTKWAFPELCRLNNNWARSDEIFV
jgi:serine/threonine protein kinase